MFIVHYIVGKSSIKIQPTKLVGNIRDFRILGSTSATNNMTTFDKITYIFLNKAVSRKHRKNQGKLNIYIQK